MFTISDIGCYADGTFGLQHARDKLANLLEGLTNGPDWHSDLIDSLRSDPPDDFGDEYDALEILNSRGVSWEVFFTQTAGDLLLIPSDDWAAANPDDPDGAIANR